MPKTSSSIRAIVLIQYLLVTDRQTDRHWPIANTLASAAQRGCKRKHGWDACRERTDPAVAVPAGAAVGLRERDVHHVGRDHVGRDFRRVQADRPGRGGAPLGRAQEQAQHELRQTEPRAALLLRQEHHDQGPSSSSSSSSSLLSYTYI